MVVPGNMGNVVHCCRLLSNYFQRENAPDQTEEQSPLLSRENSDEENFCPSKAPEDSEPSKALDQDHLLYPDIVLSSSSGTALARECGGEGCGEMERQSGTSLDEQELCSLDLMQSNYGNEWPLLSFLQSQTMEHSAAGYVIQHLSDGVQSPPGGRKSHILTLNITSKPMLVHTRLDSFQERCGVQKVKQSEQTSRDTVQTKQILLPIEDRVTQMEQDRTQNECGFVWNEYDTSCSETDAAQTVGSAGLVVKEHERAQTNPGIAEVGQALPQQEDITAETEKSVIQSAQNASKSQGMTLTEFHIDQSEQAIVEEEKRMPKADQGVKQNRPRAEEIVITVEQSECVLLDQGAMLREDSVVQVDQDLDAVEKELDTEAMEPRHLVETMEPDGAETIQSGTETEMDVVVIHQGQEKTTLNAVPMGHDSAKEGQNCKQEGPHIKQEGQDCEQLPLIFTYTDGELGQTEEFTLFVIDKLFLTTPPFAGYNPDTEFINHITEQNSCSTKHQPDSTAQEMMLTSENGFNVKIHLPFTESIELQVSPLAVVLEIKQVLMDRKESCHCTCFSLQLNGNSLDNFIQLKSVPGLQEGSVLKVVEEPYTVREIRIHLRHVRNLLKSMDPTDGYNGAECRSPSFLSLFTDEKMTERRKVKKKGVELKQFPCAPPEHLLPGSKQRLLAPLQPPRENWKPVECLKALTMSNWNPPPGNRKMHGDLMYLDVVTMENRQLSITASARGFYLNQSTTYIFNPKPASPGVLCHDLTDLLSQISPIFKRNFSALLKKRDLCHLFERMATPLQLFSWTAPELHHSVDCVRAEDASSSHLGYEEHVPGQTRDWNEEFQSIRELPRQSLSERLQRSRAMFQVNSDFVAAATCGAMAVVDGSVMPINPSEEPRSRMFIWNNIFFSLGFDIRDHYRELGGDAAAHAAASNDLNGVRAYSALDAEGLYLLGTAVVDYRGYRVTAQSIVPGILERNQEESIVYGSADFGKTVFSDDRFLELLDKPSRQLRIQRHQVLDKDDQKVELCSSVECKGIVGNDGRRYILDLLRTFPSDLNFLPVEREEVPPECKKLGFPHQHPHRLACLRQELVEVFVEHRKKLLTETVFQRSGQERHTSKTADSIPVKDGLTGNALLYMFEKSEVNQGEMDTSLIADTETSFSDTQRNNKAMESKDSISSVSICEKELAKTVLTQKREETVSRNRVMMTNADSPEGPVSQTPPNIHFNPNLFSAEVRFPKESKKMIEEQKQLLKDAAAFLVSHQIPALIKGFLDYTVVPMDGHTLTEALHQHGINVRYLGKMLEFLENTTHRDRLDHVYRISMYELITRCAKHLFKTYLLAVEPSALSAFVSHFLNCLLSFSPDVKGSQHTKRPVSRRRSRCQRGSAVSWSSLTTGELWRNIQVEAQEYYHYSLQCESVDHAVETYGLQRITLLRELTIKTGIQVLNREYQFGGKHRTTFTEEDILNIFPRVKHINPKPCEAHHLLRCGQARVQQGCLKDGCDLINQALSFFTHVYGPLHQDVCTCLRLLGRIHYILTDYPEALVHQQKAVLISERVLGVDHPSTIQEYMNLGLYCFANGQLSTALRLLYRARYLMVLVCGDDHPEMARLDSKIGLMLHGGMECDLSVKFLENALTLTLKYHGASSLKLAQSHHLLAKVYESKGEFRSALRHERESYTIYRNQVGETHDKTCESSEYLKHLTQQAVIMQRTINIIQKNSSDTGFIPLNLAPPSKIWILEKLNLITGIVLIPLRTWSNKNVEDMGSDAEKTPQTSQGNL